MYRIYGVMSGMRGLEALLLVLVEFLYGIDPFKGIYIFASFMLFTLMILFAVLALFDYLVGPTNSFIGTSIFLVDMILNAWLLYSQLSQLYAAYIVTLLVTPLSNLLVDILAILVSIETVKK
ncbi:hypothetical protein GCM10007981_06920 [Thermocladium modestius]|uniref:Uncharacterized protein n=1 Tax=Thermocladium modestius TaxID=62609 RepID=A0A830GSF1_9CREN|nr:hypothetical protein [Thermocladium modestius]GGP20122.1 hypothetical protein GCM10007981_06920 [Thermocladium modestius]